MRHGTVVLESRAQTRQVNHPAHGRPVHEELANEQQFVVDERRARLSAARHAQAVVSQRSGIEVSHGGIVRCFPIRSQL